MTLSLAEITEEAMSLTTAERRVLAARLWDSVEETETDPAFLAVLAERQKHLQLYPETAISWEDFMAEMNAETAVS